MSEETDIQDLLAALPQRYPFLIGAPDVRVGWLPVVEALLQELAALPVPPEVWELDRRQYGLRVSFFEPDSPEEADFTKAAAIAERYSDVCFTRCEICGATGAKLIVAGERFLLACSIHQDAELRRPR